MRHARPRHQTGDGSFTTIVTGRGVGGRETKGPDTSLGTRKLGLEEGNRVGVGREDRGGGENELPDSTTKARIDHRRIRRREGEGRS